MFLNNNTILIVGIVFILISIPLYLKKISKNLYYGFRYKYTLADNEIWIRVNKLGGLYFLIGGLLLSTLSTVNLIIKSDNQYLIRTAEIVLIIVLVVSLIHTFLLSLRLAKSKNIYKTKIKEEPSNPIYYYYFLNSIYFIMLLIGILHIIKEIPPNGMVGIRTAKTLYNEEIWYEVHYYAGYCIVIWSLINFFINQIFWKKYKQVKISCVDYIKIVSIILIVSIVILLGVSFIILDKI